MSHFNLSDDEKALIQMLRKEGWNDEAVRMLMHSESTTLRTMALTNVTSRINIAKAQQ